MWRRLVEAKGVNRSQVVTGIAIVVVLGYLTLLFLPRRAMLATLAREHDELESRATIQRAALARLDDDAPSPSPAKAADVRLALPSSPSIAELVAESTRRARAAGLSVEQIQRRPDKTEDGYVVVALTVLLRGTYAQFAACLAAIEQMTRIVNVIGFTMRTRDRSPTEQDYVIDASCELRAYHFVDQVPVKNEAVQAAEGDSG